MTKRIEPKPRVCVVCGTGFLAARARATCSDECHTKNRRQAYKKSDAKRRPSPVYDPRPCEWCGAIYTPRAGGPAQRACSTACAKKVWAETAQRCEVEGCGRLRNTGTLCKMHVARLEKFGEVGGAQALKGKFAPDGPTGGEWENNNGYRQTIVRENGVSRKVLVHRLVMEEHLGRRLLPAESVHHKNGIRDDNRLENLELWSKSQPSGQRVADKLAWAREFIALYGDL